MSPAVSMPISIYALGGLGEVGKNTYVVESEDSILIIDAGVKFPEETLPGVEYVIPDYTQLKNNRSKIKALVITHGHEDHIGGIPFLIQTVHIPVIYAPRLAAALIKQKLEDNRIKEPVNIVEYDNNSHLSIGEFKVSFFRVTHSIPDSFGIVVDTPQGRICTTGDFKIDLTPVGPDIELSKIAKLGTEGVDLLLSDSTNAEIEGYTPSEKNVIESINDIFRKTQGRLIVSTFSSNISRIQQVVESAVSFNRKLIVIGRSMENAVKNARKFGYIKIPDNSLVGIDAIRTLKLNEVCILCTGSQGEPMAALARIANGDNKVLRLLPGDTVVFSSSPIPGNGVSIENIINQLTRAGADVLTNSVFLNIHSSGHPSKQELRLMLKLMKPKYFMPVHGEYRMLKIHGEIAQQVGLPKDHIFICDNGDSVTLFNHKVSVGDKVQADNIYIDGNDLHGLSTKVIQDRNVLNNDGMVAALIAIDFVNNRLMMPVTLYTRGFVTLTSGHLIPDASKKVEEVLTALLAKKASFNEIKQVTKTTLDKYLFQRTQRSPMIIPVIMNANDRHSRL